MTRIAEQIFNEAINLSPIDRAELIERIIESFDTEPNNEIQKAWAEEAEKRLALHVNEETNSIAENEVFQQIERLNKK